MSGPSGWCADYRGICTSEKAHRVCQMRLDDPKVQLACDCEAHGGHTQEGNPCPT